MQDQPSDTRSSGAAPFQNTTLKSDDITPHKVHIRGLDDMTTEDITSYLAENMTAISHSRIEWIDDTSANIVFPTPASALKALREIISQSTHDASIPDLQLCAAKPYTARPAADLRVRLALITDQKRPRAYQASRFYMMHPDLDPREKARREKTRDGGGGYRSHRYGQDEQRRRRKNDRDQGYDASMYDDNPITTAKTNGRSMTRQSSSSMMSVDSSEEAVSPGDLRSRRSRRGGDHFRPGTRNRSASPAMERDDAGGRRLRRRTPPPSWKNSSKELFPSKPTLGTALTGATSQELFPNKKHAANLKKELFPGKPHTSHHRRTDAIDAADVTADLFANRLAFTNTTAASAKPSESSYGRLNAPSQVNSDIDHPTAAGGLNIRGASKQNQGFNIRGIAADGQRVGVIKELFPDKAGSNSGKELFAEKLEGRGGRRNLAADLSI